jgi:hypothetical protein
MASNVCAAAFNFPTLPANPCGIPVHIDPGIDPSGKGAQHTGVNHKEQHFVATDMNADGGTSERRARRGEASGCFGSVVGMHEFRDLRASEEGIGFRTRSHGSHPRELVGNWRQHSNSDKSRIGADGLSRLRQYWHQRKVISGMERIPSPKAA